MLRELTMGSSHDVVDIVVADSAFHTFWTCCDCLLVRGEAVVVVAAAAAAAAAIASTCAVASLVTRRRSIEAAMYRVGGTCNCKLDTKTLQRVLTPVIVLHLCYCTLIIFVCSAFSFS